MCKPLYKCRFIEIIIPEVPKQKQRPEAKFPVSLRACYMGFFIFSLPYFVYHPNSSRIISRISLGGSFRCHAIHLLFCFAKFTRLCFYHPNSLRICSRSSRSGPLSGRMFFASFLIVRISIKILWRSVDLQFIIHR